MGYGWGKGGCLTRPVSFVFGAGVTFYGYAVLKFLMLLVTKGSMVVHSVFYEHARSASAAKRFVSTGGKKAKTWFPQEKAVLLNASQIEVVFFFLALGTL